MSKLTKKMYERCLNPKWVVWKFLEPDVQEVLKNCERREAINAVGLWFPCELMIQKPHFPCAGL